MKLCPKCQTKNEESNGLCKSCGVQLSESSFEDKKKKVLGAKRRSYWVSGSLAILAIGLGGITYWTVFRDSGASSKVSSPPKVTGRIDYTGQSIQMGDIRADVHNGKISIPLDVLMKRKIVRFEYDGSGVKIPLLAYITQSGRVVTAISMCEPCRSTRFHIQGKTLVCNACSTEWDLESLRGIRGGCLNYPPEVIPSTVGKDRIEIDETIVARWKPRI